jgi:hypothetical protein
MSHQLIEAPPLVKNREAQARPRLFVNVQKFSGKTFKILGVLLGNTEGPWLGRVRHGNAHIGIPI